jgi:CBS domain containing-hemolysin-like protein
MAGESTALSISQAVMTMTDLSGLVWLVVLLIANAFFVGSEFAVISARRAQIEPLADRGNPAAKITLKAMENVSLMLATAQLGITVSSLLILVVAEPSIKYMLQDPLSAIGLNYATVSVASFIIALLLVTYLHVVLGEMVPKNIAISVPTSSALILGPMLYFVAQLVKPVVWVLNQISNGILRLFGFTPTDEANSAFTLEQVEDIVQESQRHGMLVDSSKTISNTFEFTEKVVGDIKHPLEALITLPPDATPAKLQEAVSEYGFSRYPVKSGAGDLIGYWHIKDALIEESEKFNKPLQSKRMRTLISVSESAELEDALAQMRKYGAHIARTFSSDGTITGCLFLEDIIEVLVGEIEDATRR